MKFDIEVGNKYKNVSKKTVRQSTVKNLALTSAFQLVSDQHIVCIQVISYSKISVNMYFNTIIVLCDRLCGLVVRVSGYRYRGLGFDSRRYQIF